MGVFPGTGHESMEICLFRPLFDLLARCWDRPIIFVYVFMFSRTCFHIADCASTNTRIISSLCGRGLRYSFQPFLCVPLAASLDNWLPRASHAGHAQGRNRDSEAMSVRETVSVFVSARLLNLHLAIPTSCFG